MLIVTAEEMRALDARTIEGGHTPGIELMRRAGAGVVAAIERRYGSLLGLRALVLCGTGHNGGDGFVAARRFAERGASVTVALLGDPARVKGDAASALAAMRSAGLDLESAGDEDALGGIVRRADHWDIALDALLGTGARGAPEGAVAAGVQALRELDEAGTRVIAVDVPTGVDTDTGEIARRAVRADLTVTFGAPKRGHVLYPGRAFVGTLEVVDIGLLPPPEGDSIGLVRLATRGEMAARVPHRDPRAHKGTAGRVLVIGGSLGLVGAVTLTARAASRTGAGYVQVCVPASLHDVVAAKLTEQMPIPCPETKGRTLAREAFGAIEPLLERADAVALGTGLSRDPESAELARRIVAGTALPVVVDADALHALSVDASPLARASGPRVLTPHLIEMGRLTGEDAEAIDRRRIDAPREWARRWNATVVLKGAPTVSAAPDGRAIVNPTGNPGMATAGMGDVLTGVVAALLAQGLAPLDAAGLGAFIHGEAGDRAAASRGMLGIVSGDVVEGLPYALRALAHERDAAAGGGAAR